MASLHVSISAEPVIYIGDFAITNSMFTSLLVSTFIIIFALIANKKIQYTRRPQGLQNFVEFVVDALHNLTSDIVQSAKTTALIFPLTTTFFFFILLNNWAGLLPGVGTIGINEPIHLTAALNNQVQAADNKQLISEAGETASLVEDENLKKHAESEFIPIFRAGTADLNTTIALALVSMVVVQGFGFKYLGLGYLKKFFNFKNPIFTFVGILELISEIAKIISFAFRLFGNIFAGEVLLVVIASLIPILVPIPFLGLEIFVGLVQALVFTMLSIVFMSMATHAHEEH
jgi:F-type H+-transporting ATPase subunit a